MIICSECKDSFFSHHIYCRHLPLSHGSITVFKCGEQSCSNSYTSLRALRRHINIEHVENIESQNHEDELNVQSTVEQAVEQNYENDYDNFSHDSIFDTSEYDQPSLNDNVENLSTELSSNYVNTDEFIKFAAKLHSYVDVPRTRVQNIINDTAVLVKSMMQGIKCDVKKALDSNCDKEEVLKKIEQILDIQSSKFSTISNEWHCFKHFKQLGTYIAPQSYLLGERVEFVKENAVQVTKAVPVTGQFIPIRLVFQKFFEIPGLLNETLEYIESLTSNKLIISNSIQGSLWKTMTEECQNKIVMPLFLCFDDYENNNPLGSHNGISKCGAVYLSIPCLPRRLRSKLKNIFLFILFNTLDRKVFSNAIIFSKAMYELTFIETNGIEVHCNGGIRTIYFKLALILGDNLGLHSLLGFRESFNCPIF